MKNEPAITYNHIDEDYSPLSVNENEKKTYPVSLYLILVADVVLMGALIFFTFRILF